MPAPPRCTSPASQNGLVDTSHGLFQNESNLVYSPKISSTTIIPVAYYRTWIRISISEYAMPAGLALQLFFPAIQEQLSELRGFIGQA
ncbi:hypothetical protein SCP_0402300 [Sparassis crispa]|uniref:Uncharacterized protein n=1 Tax=Sparassis crispa TaxID=139825 RepID=A0A401GI38_9APHY|nr:hypothetical protein SCP_0402300 [Sparassis crispa]GBE81856.1 hypothetical protein SCP_0402300 [Sparassis crispa]